MNAQVLLSFLTLAAQLAAFYFALRLMRQPGNRTPAVVLMAFLLPLVAFRAYSLVSYFLEGNMRVGLIIEESTLVISCLILVGIVYITKLILLERTNRQAAASAEARYRTLFDQSPYGVLLFEENGTLVDFNDRACRQLGYTREEFKKLSISDIDALERPEETMARFERVGRDGKAEFEVKHKTKNGEIRDVQVITQTVQLTGRTYHHSIWRDITERVTAAEAIRKNEELLRQAARVSRIGIFDHIHADPHIYWSPEQRTIYGWNDEEPVTLPAFLERIHSEDREEIGAAVKRAHDPAGDGAFDVEHRITRRDGTIRWVVTRSRTFFEGEGSSRRPTRTVGATLDITERKEMERSLRESEEKFRTLFESVSDALVILDLEGRILDANSVAYERLGYTKQELLSMSLYQLDPPDYAAILPKRMEDIQKTGRGSIESAHKRKDGTIMPVEINAALIEFQGRKLIVSDIRDVTERKRAEGELQTAVARAKEEQAKTEAIITAIGDGLVIVDEQYRVIYQNDAVRKIIGDMIGKVCYQAGEGRESRCENCPVERTFADGRVHRVERSRQAQTETVHMDITSSPLRDSTGKIIAVIEVVRDITERKLVEEARRRIHDDLEILVKERTAELTMVNEQLRGLFTYIQEARENERTTIAREIHDELGQALTALKIDLSWLKKRLSEERKPVADKIRSMSELVEATVEVVKRISMALRPGILDHLGLPAAIGWQAGEFQKRTGIRCDIVCDPEDIGLDRERSTTIFRVFQETLTNIARHAKAKKVDISLLEDADDVVLSVKDNGKGITKEQMTDLKSLGLIGMRERVHYWGGKLEILGTPKQGTEVYVRIPRGVREDTRDKEKASVILPPDA